MYAIYILLCSDGSYYTGLTNDLDRRVWQHETGHFVDCYTYKRRPVQLVWQTRLETLEEASKLEKQIKGWTRKKKEALIKNDIPELKELSKSKTYSQTLRQAQGQIDYLIIGQGISGTWLSYYLRKERKSFIVIDNNQQSTPSRLAAGIINPVTGRRHVEVWMADQLSPFIWKEYNDLGTELGITAISQKNIIDFFPSAQMRLSFQQRVEEKGSFVSLNSEENKFREIFDYEFGFGEIDPVYTVHAEKLLPAWRKVLQENDQLLEEEFEISELTIQKEKISYKNIYANKVIFCDGVASAGNSFFKNLPFAPNKGEALIVEIPDLPRDHIYKKGMMLAPLSEQGMWWLGSNYTWEFDNENPTKEFRENAETLLKNWIKSPISIQEHICGIRPATLERRPFVGTHPQFPAVAILNGMGTKGFSLAPFFAKQLADHLSIGSPIHPEADISRFARILSRNNS